MDRKKIAGELVKMAKMLLVAGPEEKAIEFGSKASNVKKRLMEAKAVLSSDFKKRMGKGKFDARSKRLISDDGTFALEWRVRMFPDRPEGSRNQQTNRGAVAIVKL